MLPSDGQRLYIDPSTYGDLLAALTNFASEINKSCVKLEKIIGGGQFYQNMLVFPQSRINVNVDFCFVFAKGLIPRDRQ